MDFDFLALDPVSWELGQQLATAAKQGNWPEVFMLLDDEQGRVVPWQWRPGGKRWFTVLHQAAWHGAPEPIVRKLIKRGALRWLPDASGRLPFDVAAERGHLHLLSLLKPPKIPLGDGQLHQLNMRLAALIYEDLSPFDKTLNLNELARHEGLRLPPVEVLHEIPRHQAWSPMPDSVSNFRVALRLGYLEVVRWPAVQGKITGPVGVHLVTPLDTVDFDL